MSASLSRAQAVVDAGSKAVSLDSGPPILDPSWGLYPPPTPGAAPSSPAASPAASSVASPGVPADYKCAGDEHGLLLYPAAGAVAALGAAPPLPPRGALLRLQPGHCDPTVNLYDWIVAYRGRRVEGVWRIAGRGPGA
ncbi:hypothetical protein MNEG_12885 [Monoraphidium neglectum]|uniref:D-serine dehydratase-like domain-containing protein n=1 Tax=Monoraphidium neglectum TaxID=145388 RepID=A0A0D2J5B1_9CHLO|nr:hypothetical protein MNEG_12885 [Monoraphidium neglectum]KIY95077.1 hypothetical protein MNEG_12885 [Monoraphidium neglectum]|eukprot:XP_013894097.1 hypothetical protein MNEG_12885 [Monoraphidium neglectum]